MVSDSRQVIPVFGHMQVGDQFCRLRLIKFGKVVTKFVEYNKTDGNSIVYWRYSDRA